MATLKAVDEPVDNQLADWLDGLPCDMRDRLTTWGLLDRRRSMSSLPIGEHLDAWIESVLADGRTQEHAGQLRSRVEKIIKGCGVHTFGDLDELAVKSWLASQSMKIRTRNHYKTHLRQFCTWMIEYGRATRSPLTKRGFADEIVTDERERRALSESDVQKLLETTEKGPVRGHMTGPERATLYWLAAETGLRANELRSLRVVSFDLDADRPTVKTRAAVRGNKAKRTVWLQLTPALTARLKDHLANKLPKAPAFDMPTKQADMLKFDLERAGIPYKDDEDAYFDFHSLRVQCATDLARNGVHPKDMQNRLRHSQSKLTRDIYTKVRHDDQDAAIAATPKRRVSA